MLIAQRDGQLELQEGTFNMKTLVSLLVGGLLLFGSLTLGTQTATAQNRDRDKNAQNNMRDNNNNHRRHRRHHHRRHRRHRHQHADKLSY